MQLPIASFLAGLFAIFMVVLSFQVSLRRVKTGNTTADGAGDETLRRRIRGHGNFIEYSPLAVICVGFIEFASGPPTLVSGLGTAFLISRLVHAFGMLYFSTPTARGIAMLIQHASFLIAGTWLVLKASTDVL